MSEEDTFCRNPYCTKGCEEFVPGPKIGRDQWRSCATCTHSRQIHQPRLNTTERKRKA